MQTVKFMLGLPGAATLAASAIIGAARSNRSASAAEVMAEAANAFLAGLDESLRAKACYTFDDPARIKWHYYPTTPEPRKGVVLEKLITRYVERHPAEAAGSLLKEINDAGLEKIHFGWAGPMQPELPHYYRVQGPTFVIGFCNAQNRAKHCHAVFRRYTGDFGMPMK